MARLSESVISRLASPGYTRGMFQAGEALAGIGSQYRAKKAEDEFNVLMAKATEAQKNNNDVALFNIAQQLRAMGRQEAASAVSATATKMKDTKRQGELASAVDVASQIARRGETVPDYLLQDIQGLGGTEEVKNVRQLMREQQSKTQESILEQVLTSPDFDFNNRQDVADYFAGASQMEGLAPGKAREIFNAFKNGGKDPNVQRSIIKYFRDPVTGDTYTQVEMVMKDSTTRLGPITADPGSKPYTGQNLVRTDEKDFRAQSDKPEMARKEALEVDFAKLKVGATAKLPELRDTAAFLNEAIQLLESEEVRTGGVPRRMSKAFLTFIGSPNIPEKYGTFEGLLADAVMSRLQGFAGAISDGEREYAINTISNELDPTGVNAKKLAVLFRRTNKEINRAVGIGSANDYTDYRRSIGLVTESDFYGVPQQYRASAMEDVKSGRRTYKEVMQMFENARAGGDL